MIDAQMTVSTKHKSIVASEAIGVNDGPSPDRLDCHIQDFLSGEVRHYLSLHHTVSLENTEDGNLSCGTTASLTLSAAPEVGFIHFDFAVKKNS